MPGMVLLLAMAAAAGPPAALDPQALADGFVAALVQDDTAALDAIAAGGKTDAPRWHAALNAVAYYNDLRPTPPVVTRVSDDGQETVLDVAFAGHAVTAGVRRESEPLPGRWRLVAVRSGGSWALAAAATAERHLAEKLATATAPELDAALAADPQLDVHQFLVQLADTASETADPAGEETPLALTWALETSRERRDAAAECDALRMRSYSEAQIQRRYAAAIASAGEALAVGERAGDEDLISRSLFSLGVAQWLSGDVPLAVETLQRSARSFDALRDPRAALRAVYMAGTLESFAGRLRSALSIAREHERLLRRYPWPSSAMDVRFLLGGLHSLLGNDDFARRAYAEAEELARSLGDKVAVALARFDLAMVEADAGRLSAARDLLASAVADAVGIERSYLPSFYADLGSLQMELGELNAAEASLAEALAVARSIGLQGMSREVMARQSELRLRQGRPREALKSAQEATTAYEEPIARLHLPVTPGRARRALGLSLQALGKLSEAEVAFRVAIDEVDAALAEPTADPLVSSGGRSATAPFRSLVALLATQGRGAEALAIADGMRARALRGVLERGRVDLSATLSAAEREREAELDGQLVELNRSLVKAVDVPTQQRLSAARDEARLALQRFRAELYALHPTLPQRRAEAEGEPRAGWSRALPPGAVAVEWMVAEDQTLAFLVTRRADGEVQVDVRRIAASAVKLGTAVERLSAALASRGPAVDRPARELYQLLLAPLADSLRGASLLMMVPDGVLWRVPFQALRDADGRELVETVAVLRAPSLAAVALAAGNRREPVTHPRLLALGNPTIGDATASASSPGRGRGSGDLPEAEREVRSLGRLYGTGRSELHVGPAARERLLKERVAVADVIHLATHGRLDDRTPLFSALVLAIAPDDGEDGLLEVREIADLDLRGRLVVLSACETGAGRWREGEGLVGMAWALMAAGSPAAVVSDWKVDSGSTELLMVEFHRRLLAGDGAARALQRAQLALRLDPRYAHPYYWAAFGVLGTGW